MDQRRYYGADYPHKDEDGFYNQSPSEQVEDDFDSHREKSLIRRIDRRLLPILGGLYSIALIDRINVSAARVAGMDADLGLSIGNRYTVALVVFIIPYLNFEMPSNIVLRKVGSANWLSFIAFSWGCTMIGQGFVTSYQTLAVCRVILGLFEAGECRVRLRQSWWLTKT
ncbi:MAG: hypothetical protein Q9198_009589 [Flavoplaca austrocitrina]